MVQSQVKLLHSHAEQFQKEMGVLYLPQLEFIDLKTERKIRERCKREERKKWLDPRQKWLGSYYSKEITQGFTLDVTIKWIDECVGYGVFTNVPIVNRAYIGEYTGIVRKRRFFAEMKNHYCFDYTIGIGRKTPYVIDAAGCGNYARYINHSTDGNIETASVLCNGIMHIIMYATESIPKGAQLCYDYGADYWARRKAPIVLR